MVIMIRVRSQLGLGSGFELMFGSVRVPIS